jgi:phosphatidylserine/phosphatidylglycerophosphate/cardiolipin synthase-like enzyme
VAGHADGVEAQLTVTMPQPFWQHSIAETWVNAIQNAERYIFIEDQYFRAPMLNEIIAERMREVPELVLVVITKPVSEWTDPGCWWTHITDTFFEEEFGLRYRLYQLRAFDYVDVGWGWDETESRFEDIDVHTKVIIVDDVFMSMGSCNHNNRGLVYEGEMNVAVLDPALVREARGRILDSILGPYSTDPDEAAAMLDDMSRAAAWNQAVWDAWDAEGWDISLDGAPLPEEYAPRGFLYPLDFRSPEDCLLEGISEDLTII